MNFVDLFGEISRNYEKEMDNQPFKNNKLANKFRKNARNILSIRGIGDNYRITASVGQGRWAKIPWIAIFDDEICTSAQKGFYVVYLFTSDYKGVYLSLNQGWTNYKETYKKEAKVKIKSVTDFWKENLIMINSNKDFTIENIDLISDGSRKNNDLAIGYEYGNICSKFYNIDILKEKDNTEITTDLLSMLEILSELKSKLIKEKDDWVTDSIEYILNDQNFKERISKQNINRSKKYEQSKKLKLADTVKFNEQGPKSSKSSINIRKNDYQKLTEQNTSVGSAGEELVLNFEKERLANSANLRKYIDEIKHVSKVEGDGHGYDIVSYDFINETKKIVPIYIEVKTTSGDMNTPFFMSKNELIKLEERKEQYRIYRVFDYYKEIPKLMVIDAFQLDNFLVEPVNFAVSIPPHS